MNIAITGASGQIGKIIVNNLLKKNIKIYCFSKSKKILNILDIKRKFYFSSEIEDIENKYIGHERNMHLCLKLKADIYYSGIGAIQYQAGKIIPKSIQIIYQNIWEFLNKNPYLDKDSFVNGLSILDALFFIGPQEVIKIFNNYEKSF